MPQKKAPLSEIRNGTVDALLLSPRTADMDALAAELTRHLVDTPELFSNDAIAVDVCRLAADKRLPTDHLAETLTVLRIHVIGMAASPEQAEWAQVFDLPLLNSRGHRPCGGNDAKDTDRNDAQDALNTPEHIQAAEAPVSTLAAPTADTVVMQPDTMIADRSSRPGQRIYARSDSIVLDLVSDGAEVTAEGNIYVYASLRGRVLVGVKGNLDTRIFCMCLESQLISIAGIYRTGEASWLDAYASKSAQTRLANNVLVFGSLRMK